MANAGTLHRFERDPSGTWFYHGVHTGSEGTQAHNTDPAMAARIERAFLAFGRTRIERQFSLPTLSGDYGVATPETIILVYRPNDLQPLAQYAVGDIAPDAPGGAGTGQPLDHTLVGALAGLIAVVVVATMFVTAEYRRGLIRTTFAASPRRGQVLAAKAIVIAAVSFTAGLVAAVIAILLGSYVLRANGNYVLPANLLTVARMAAGTAGMLAVAAVLALALGAMLRRSAIAVTVVIAAIILPYLVAVTNLLSPGADNWLMRLVPAAGFAIQQTIPNYPQVSNTCTVAGGCYPLAPWAGFAVLCAWAAAALGLALVLLRRRDA